jgi:hypothetical protein
MHRSGLFDLFVLLPARTLMVMTALDRLLRGMNRTSWIAACALMAVVALASYGQPPANPPAGGPPGTQRRPRNTDPAKMFDSVSNGRDVSSRSSLSDRQRMFFDQIMGKRGGANASPNSFISRNDFMNAISSFRAPMNRAGSGPNPPPRFGTINPSQSAPPARASNSDRNNPSGQNTPRRSRASNVDLYMAMSAFSAPTPQLDVPRPTMFRADKLQANVSTWFSRLDTDHDGQIGLYEWVDAGLNPAEFKMIDRNDDGLITPEEMDTQMKGGMIVPNSNGMVLTAGNRPSQPNFENVTQFTPTANPPAFDRASPDREQDPRGRPRAMNRGNRNWRQR